MLSFSRWRSLVDSRSGNKKQSQLIKKSLQIGGAKIEIFKYEEDIYLTQGFFAYSQKIDTPESFIDFFFFFHNKS